MKKELFSLIAFLVLLMAGSASSIDGEQNDQEPHHQNLTRHNTIEETGANPCARMLNFLPSRSTCVKVTAVTFMGLIVCVQYLHQQIRNELEEKRCYPAVHSSGFDAYNAHHGTHLNPTCILSHLGVDYLSSNWFELDEFYKLNKQFLFKLMNKTSNDTHILCQYGYGCCPDVHFDLAYDRLYHPHQFYSNLAAYVMYISCLVTIMLSNYI